MRRRVLMLLILTPSAICIGLLVLELVVRLILPAVPSYAQIQSGELIRLRQANAHATFDILGLYSGAQSVTLHITPDRFIAPAGTRSVLFLGGSTTESLFVPESERWVALVGGYNAGQSGSSIVDEISVFDYLTAEGHRFDTVFVTTMINDFIWYRRLGTLNPEGYKARQTAYYERTDPTPWWAKISRIGAKLYQLGQTNSVTHRHIDQKSQMEFGRHVVGLADCPNTANLIAPWTVEETSAMRRLNTAVTATGARLVAMTETTGFSAPASSFAVDMRETFLCGSDGMLSMADTALVFERVQQAYLEAARTAGIDSFDLKTQMAAYSDGADGGYYTYDGVHLTPPGSHQVAQFVNDYLKTVE